MRQGGRRHSDLARGASPGRFLPKGVLAKRRTGAGDGALPIRRCPRDRKPRGCSSRPGCYANFIPRRSGRVDEFRDSGRSAARLPNNRWRRCRRSRASWTARRRSAPLRPSHGNTRIRPSPSLPIESRGRQRRRRPTDGSTIPRAGMAKITQRKNKRRPVPGLVGTTCRGLNRADKICAHH